MMAMTAAFSPWGRMCWCTQWGLHKAATTTMGTNSLRVMWASWCPVLTAAGTTDSHWLHRTSSYQRHLRLEQHPQLREYCYPNSIHNGENIATPFHLHAKMYHHPISDWASLFRRLWWSKWQATVERLMRHLRKALPGFTNLQAWDNDNFLSTPLTKKVY